MIAWRLENEMVQKAKPAPRKKSRGPRTRPGLRDIAKEANLSITAVSFAMNGTGRLGEETRKRVRTIAGKLGYRANAHARNLRRKTSGVLAITASLPAGIVSVLPNMDYFMGIWRSAMTTALKRGYMLLLVPFGTEPRALAEVPVDGGIVIDPVVNDPLVRHFEGQKLPVVTIGRDLGRGAAEAWWVDNDHAALTRAALDHLFERGARRIGLILAAPKYFYSAAARQTYEEWAIERGMRQLVAEVLEAPTESAGYEAALRMLDSSDPPDAVYASLDRFAVGTLFAASKQLLRVPDDLMIVAGDDGGNTQTAQVPITALDLDPGQLGQAAVNLLLDRLEGKLSHRFVLVPGSLRQRASTHRSVIICDAKMRESPDHALT
jgi:DNA-binding LacI/PurR family transcriptional regulator